MKVYLQHKSERPIHIEIKDQAKYEAYAKQGFVELKGKRYEIITESDLEAATEVFWGGEPAIPVPESKRVTWDELKAKAKEMKATKKWRK